MNHALHLVMIWEANKINVIVHLLDKVTNIAEIILGFPWVLGVTGYQPCVICSIACPAYLSTVGQEISISNKEH